ncbi:MAG: ATP synthase F1 subunit gamma [Bacteroidales bacterium]|nr:ATP synthase F1 subunit gamma [Bacteroidales bacterium]
MGSLKEIRSRISSVKSTKQITSAMKMVSAAKLKKAQDSILQMRPYASKLQEILKHISSNLDTIGDNQYTSVRPLEKIALIIVTANRGLCGGFNSNPVRKTIDLLNTEYADLHNKGAVDLMLIGKKGADILKSKGYKFKVLSNEILEKPNFEEVEKQAQTVINWFIKEKYDRIDIIYNEFKNAASQILTHEKFLPVEMNENESSSINHNYIFEPSLEYMIRVLIPEALKIQFYKSILDPKAAEHGARMTAMHQATDNATELIRELNLEYNKARQATITNEILEIVSGAEALKS